MMSERPNFRITVNLQSFFRDHRRSCKIFISKKIKTINDLAKHISNIFKISEFYIVNQSDYLPPTEDVRVLKQDDIVEIFPNFELVSNKVVVEDQIVTTPVKKKKKKRAKNDEDMYIGKKAKKIKMESPPSTSTPAETITKMKREKKEETDSAICSNISLIDSNKLGFVEKLQYFEDWSEKDSPGCSLKNKSKIIILSNELIPRCDKSKSEESNKNVTSKNDIIKNDFSTNIKEITLNNDTVSKEVTKNIVSNEEPIVKLATTYYNNSDLRQKSFLPETVLTRETNLVKSIVNKVVDYSNKSSLQILKNGELNLQDTKFSSNLHLTKSDSNLQVTNNSDSNLQVTNNSDSNLQVTNNSDSNSQIDDKSNLNLQVNNFDKKPTTSLAINSMVNNFKRRVFKQDHNFDQMNMNNFDSNLEPENVIDVPLATTKNQELDPNLIDISKNGLQKQVKEPENSEVKSAVSLDETEIESNYEGSIVFESDSKDSSLLPLKVKRKRTRKRPMKKPAKTEEPQSIQVNTPFNPPRVSGKPKMHIIFNDTPIEIQDSAENLSSNKIDNFEICVNITNPKDDLNAKEIMKKSDVKLNLMDKVLPKIGDQIEFRVLKLDKNYTPTLSNLIAAKVINFNESTGDINLYILVGKEELTEPDGKFSLPNDDINGQNQKTEYGYYTNWRDLREPRIMEFTNNI